MLWGANLQARYWRRHNRARGSPRRGLNTIRDARTLAREDDIQFISQVRLSGCMCLVLLLVTIVTECPVVCGTDAHQRSEFTSKMVGVRPAYPPSNFTN